MTLTAPDTNALRNQHPHIVIPHMSVLVPRQVYCGQVLSIDNPNGRGAREITVVDVSGDFADIIEGHTMFVGDACGDYSKSRRRVRSTTSYLGTHTITVDENTVIWESGDYITIMENWELWPIKPFIDQSGNYTFYKDRDIAYSDQNDQPPPVAIMGGHRAKFLDGPDVSFPLVGTGSYAVAQGASITDYLWECTTALSIASPTSATTTITFDTPGHHWVSLTVTDDNGKNQITRRVYWVHPRTGANATYDDFEIDGSVTGSWSNGGFECRIRVRDKATIEEFPDGTLVLIWAENFFAGEERYIRLDNNTILAGYIGAEAVTKDLDTGDVQFDLATIHKDMQNARLEGVSLEYRSSATTWWQMPNLTIARAVHHFWKWHSTLLEIVDVVLPIANTELLSAVDDFEEGNLYSMVDAFTFQHGIFAHVCCNKYGQVRVEVDIQMLSETDRAAQGYILDMIEDDRRGTPDVVMNRDPENRVGLVFASGFNFDGTTDTPVISQAPGEISDYFGSGTSVFERLVLEDQSDGNFVAGRVYCIANRELLEIRVRLAGNYYHAFDIIPQDWALFSLSANDNKRGLELTQIRAVIRDINATFNIQGGYVDMEIILEPECFGPDGVPGEYPTGDPWGWTFPYPEFPDFPPWYIPETFVTAIRSTFHYDQENNVPIYSYLAIMDASGVVGTTSALTNTMADTDPPSVISDSLYIYYYNDNDPTNVSRVERLTGALTQVSIGANAVSAKVINLIDVSQIAILQDNGLGTQLLRLVDFDAGTVTTKATISPPSGYDYNLGHIWMHTVNRGDDVGLVTIISQDWYNNSASDVDLVGIHIYGWTSAVLSFVSLWQPTSTGGTGLTGAGIRCFAPPVYMNDKLYSAYSPAYGSGETQRESPICEYNFETGVVTNAVLTRTDVGTDAPQYYNSSPSYTHNKIFYRVQEPTSADFEGLLTYNVQTHGISVDATKVAADMIAMPHSRLASYRVTTAGDVYLNNTGALLFNIGTITGGNANQPSTARICTTLDIDGDIRLWVWDTTTQDLVGYRVSDGSTVTIPTTVPFVAGDETRVYLLNDIFIFDILKTTGVRHSIYWVK